MKATLYIGNTCHYCHTALDWLCEHGIDVEQKNVTENLEHRKELMEMGIMSVPYLIYGSNRIAGFDVNKYKEVFEK